MLRKGFIYMLKIDDTALILIDYQGKLASIMHKSEELLTNLISLIKGVQMLEVPIIWLEQYPKGLGPTVDVIKQLLDVNHQPIAKMCFSSCQSIKFQETLDKLGKENYVVAGIEAHICVYQTVHELLSMGKHVEYVQDGISSRTIENKQIAINKMNLLGAFPTSV